MHPLENARHLIEQYAPMCGARDEALRAIDDMLPYCDADLRLCSECGVEFFLTQPAREFFLSRNMTLPHRCKWCRQRRKAAGR